MTSFGKKILSAFIEMTDEQKPAAVKPVTAPVYSATPVVTTTTDSRFKEYFGKLFTEANIPGPDYFEFVKVLEAVQGIPDEKMRYSAAFAGLQVQGLDKQKLLSTAEQYLQVLHTDAANFHRTVDTTLQEKVTGKKKEIENMQQRIQQLEQEIKSLHHQTGQLQKEIQENEERIEASTGGYKNASDHMKSRILHDIEKIKHYIQ